ncbi:MAG TPA: TetR/AcrR family transcriptional regulator [Solirubrobacterales bacterium]|nr:TetR/AcrR family transcriptional regulator [Solirubrobacterales bacterium]
MPARAAKAPRPRLSRDEVRDRLIAAATDLVRERSYYELSVAEVTERAGIERTIFYRHFDDLADLLLRAATEAIESLYAAQVELDTERREGDLETVRAAIEPAVRVYERHGPVLRAVTEAGASNPAIAARGAELRRRFNELVTESLVRLPGLRENPPADLAETGRALNLLNEAYLRDAFGREPRVSAEVAIQTLTEIWAAFLDRNAPAGDPLESRH